MASTSVSSATTRATAPAAGSTARPPGADGEVPQLDHHHRGQLGARSADHSASGRSLITTRQRRPPQQPRRAGQHQRQRLDGPPLGRKAPTACSSTRCSTPRPARWPAARPPGADGPMASTVVSSAANKSQRQPQPAPPLGRMVATGQQLKPLGLVQLDASSVDQVQRQRRQLGQQVSSAGTQRLSRCAAHRPRRPEPGRRRPPQSVRWRPPTQQCRVATRCERQR